MTDVFISYSRRNSLFARRMIDKLILSGKDAWVDWEGIPLTSPNWWGEIKAGIEGADNFVFILSPDAMASVVCNMELDYAIELNKRIVPVAYRNVETRDAFASIADFAPDEAMQERLAGKDPLIIARDNWQRLSHINWLFFRDEDDFEKAFESLITTVETDLEYVKAHTRYLVRAQEWEHENKRADLLLFGEEIEHAEIWLKKAETYVTTREASSKNTVSVVNPLPKDLHREYIRLSRQADQRRRQLVLSAQLSIVVLVIVLIAGLLIGSSIIGQTQQQAADIQSTSLQNVALANEVVKTAEKQANLAETREAEAENVRATAVADGRSFELAGRALLAQNDNMDEALMFAYEAIAIENPPPNALRVFYQMVYQSRHRKMLNAQSSVSVMEFSPDSRLLASAGRDGTIKLWDMASDEVVKTLSGHINTVNSVAFNFDGSLLASGSEDKTIKLWDVASGKELQTLTEHEDFVWSVIFSPDGKMLASTSKDMTIKLWDVASGEVLQNFSEDNEGVWQVAFSPDGTLIASAYSDENIRLWDVTNGEILQSFAGDNRNMIFSPDARLLANSNGDGTFQLWDLIDAQVSQTLRGHQSFLVRAVFSPDGRLFASWGADELIQLWDVTEAEVMQTLQIHEDFLATVAISPDGQTLASASGGGTIHLWDVAAGAEVVQTLSGHKDRVLSVAFSPDGQTLASGSDGQINASANADDTLHLWDVASGKVLKILSGATGYVAFSPDGRLLASGAYDNNEVGIQLWDMTSGEELPKFNEQGQYVTNVVFSPDGKILASVERSKIQLWDVADQRILRTLSGHTSFVMSIAFSPDARLLASASYGYDDSNIKLWDVASGEELQTFGLNQNGNFSVAFSPDGQMLASGSGDRSIQLWDVANAEILQTLNGHEAAVNSVAFSPDGRLLASGSDDKTVKLWDVMSGQVLQTLNGHEDAINSVAFSPDGRLLASGSDDKTVKLWRVGLDDLRLWISENRYIPEFDCEARQTFNIRGQCDADGDFPTRTPYPTLTPFSPSS